jgi:hypothetical protein
MKINGRQMSSVAYSLKISSSNDMILLFTSFANTPTCENALPLAAVAALLHGELIIGHERGWEDES